MPFSFEQEKNCKSSFLDVEIPCKKEKFVSAIYRKPTFSGAYTHFENFLPTVYKFGMAFVYRCLKLCFDWTKFHKNLVF